MFIVFNMKILLFIGLVIAATLLQADARATTNPRRAKLKQQIKEFATTCVWQLGDDGLLGKLPDIKGMKVFPEDNPAVSAMFGCIWELREIIDRQGVVYPEKLKSFVADDVFLRGFNDRSSVVDEATRNCKDVEGSDYKLKSVKMYNCVSRYLQANLHH